MYEKYKEYTIQRLCFLKYVAILIFLVAVVTIDYNKTKFVVKFCPIKYMLSLKVNDLLLKRKLADFQIE